MSVNSPYKTTKDLAAMFGVCEATIRRKAEAANIGIHLGGKAGWRYTQADVEALERSMRPQQQAPRRRRRRAA